jgi:hypothetical protein
MRHGIEAQKLQFAKDLERAAEKLLALVSR